MRRGRPPSEGKYHDLYAKALALESAEGVRSVFVTADVLTIPASLARKVSSRIKEKTGLPRAAIMLTCSHTHSGPVLDDRLLGMYSLTPEHLQTVKEYTKQLEDKLVQVILDSLEDLEPVKIYRGNGEAHFAINRRQYSQAGINIGLNPIGPVDSDVPTLKVVGESGKMMAVVFGYACHNTTLSSMQLCGGLCGFRAGRSGSGISRNHCDVLRRLRRGSESESTAGIDPCETAW